MKSYTTANVSISPSGVLYTCGALLKAFEQQVLPKLGSRMNGYQPSTAENKRVNENLGYKSRIFKPPEPAW